MWILSSVIFGLLFTKYAKVKNSERTKNWSCDCWNGNTVHYRKEKFTNRLNYSTRLRWVTMVSMPAQNMILSSLNFMPWCYSKSGAAICHVIHLRVYGWDKLFSHFNLHIVHRGIYFVIIERTFSRWKDDSYLFFREQNIGEVIPY